MLNPQLHEVVRKLYQEVLDGFASKDVNSEEFIASFPYSFFHDDPKLQQRIAERALVAEHREQAEKAIEAYYSDSAGGTLEFYLVDLIEDFLNYVILRSAGLPNALEYFERFYDQLD